MNSIFTQYPNNRYCIIILLFINSLTLLDVFSFIVKYRHIYFLWFTVDYMHFKVTYSYAWLTVCIINVLEYSQVGILKNTSKFTVFSSLPFFTVHMGCIILLQGRECILEEGRDTRLCMQPHDAFILCIYRIIEPESSKGPQRFFSTLGTKFQQPCTNFLRINPLWRLHT